MIYKLLGISFGKILLNTPKRFIYVAISSQTIIALVLCASFTIAGCSSYKYQKANTTLSKEKIEAIRLKKRNYEERQNSNGPTGVLITDEGRFEFLRIGNFRDRYVVDVKIEKDKIIPIEEIKSIQFNEQCCNVSIQLVDDKSFTIDRKDILWSDDYNHSSPFVFHSFAVVIVDDESKKPYTMLFNKLEGIRSIIIDQKNQSWKGRSAEQIFSDYNPVTEHKVNEYKGELRSKANELYLEANQEGWINLLPNHMIPTPLQRYLRFRLTQEAYGTCGGNSREGFTDLRAPVRCHIARHELDLIVNSNYSLVNDITPLSAIIVLEKLKSDVENK